MLMPAALLCLLPLACFVCPAGTTLGYLAPRQKREEKKEEPPAAEEADVGAAPVPAPAAA